MSENQRPERASEVAAERRRRDGSGVGRTANLAIPENVRAKLADEGRTPRWVNDTGNRIADLTERDDYDRVEGVEPIKVGTNDEGGPLFAYLLAKRSDFIAEDRSKIDQRRRDVEKARFDTSNAQPIQGEMGAQTYIDPATKIGRANQVLD